MYRQEYDVVNDKEVFGYLQYMLLRCRRNLNMTNVRLVQMSSYRKAQGIRIAAKLHLQSDCSDRRLLTTGMGS